jgi:hypothetical protein
LASGVTSRAKFINSLLVFINQFGFQGADLDWEYHAIAERGGRREDTQNFVLLVQETRAAFGTNYGISLPLAPDYWSLPGFDPRAMEPYVDFFLASRPTISMVLGTPMSRLSALSCVVRPIFEKSTMTLCLSGLTS